MLKKAKFVVAVMMVGCLGLPNGALAGKISHVAQVLEFKNGSADFSSKFGKNNKGNSFTDIFSFSTVGLNDFDASVWWKDGEGKDDTAIKGFKLYQANGSLLASGALKVGEKNNGQNGNEGAGEGGRDRWTLVFDNLARGAYFLQVDGALVSNHSAKLKGEVSLSPVPEIDIYAMLLAGLGLIGFLSRRSSVNEKFT